MKKIKSVKSNQLLLKFIVKCVISTVVSLLAFTYLFTMIVYKLDLDLENMQVFSLFICALCAITVSFISTTGLKNNGWLMGVISVLPLILYSLFNVIFNDTSLVLFAVKAVIILLAAALTGLLSVKHSKKFKV